VSRHRILFLLLILVLTVVVIAGGIAFTGWVNARQEQRRLNGYLQRVATASLVIGRAVRKHASDHGRFPQEPHELIGRDDMTMEDFEVFWDPEDLRPYVVSPDIDIDEADWIILGEFAVRDSPEITLSGSPVPLVRPLLVPSGMSTVPVYSGRNLYELWPIETVEDDE
jgi:type II secretory pathway pseudopilin PulG